MKEQIENLQKSFELSSQQIDDAVNPLEVAALLESKKISYVLIGGHMLSYYTGTARATVDVDFIIGGADFERASRAINEAYTQFKYHNRVYHVTYDTYKKHSRDPERIDLIKDGFPLFKAVVQKFCVAIRTEKLVIKIPTIEAAIALKFAASISPNRGDENKPVDNADLMRLIRIKYNLDEQTLLALGELVYSGGGKELVAVVNDVRQGKTISL